MPYRVLRRFLGLPVCVGLVAALLVAGASHSSQAAAPPTNRDYVALVDPWIEADVGRYFFFQSASNPFGMVKLRPDTSTNSVWGTGYRKSESNVKGFSHLHDWQISGVQVMPTTGTDVPKLRGDTGWQSHVEHDDSEIVEPGYHKLHLDRYAIDAELTVTDRVGLHRYTYDRSGPSEIIVNLGGVLGEAAMKDAHITRVSDRVIEGYVVQAGMLADGHYYGQSDGKRTELYFTIHLDRPFDSMHGWAGGELVDGGAAVQQVEGDNAGVYLRYNQVDAGERLAMKVGLSFTSVDGARRNLAAELPGWDFDAVKAASQQRWSDLLGRIDVQGGTHEQQVKFYTDLFHALCGRSVVSDVDGRYLDDTWGREQIGQIPLDRNGKPTFAMYNYDALWLTQWNLNTLLGLAYPEIYSSFVKSQLQMYRDGGLLPRGPVAGNYSFVMTSSPATSFIAGAYNKGIRDFDVDLAYDAMLDAHSLGGLFDKAPYEYATWGENYGGGRAYLDKGYVPYDLHNEWRSRGAGETMEYAFQDWTLAQLARQLDKRGINAAQFADVTVSSQLDNQSHAGARAVDGRPPRSSIRPNENVEWASAAEPNPWIEMSWDEPQTLHRIVLNDRLSPSSNAQAGRLSFSDGSSIAVEDIPADGSSKTVRFPPRKVDSVRFTVTGGEGDNVGLNEIEVWDDTDTYDFLMERSRNWRKLYDDETRFIRPKGSDGQWMEPFDPLSPNDFVEASSWQATWFTSHDVMGLANLMGGETAYADKLNYAFVRSEPAEFTGIGQNGDENAFVNYGNQPGLQMAHLFNYVGYPWLSQYWVRQVKEKTYGGTSTTKGYGGHDEDQGQMGSLSALMAIGLFEVTGAGLERPVYDITSPIFDEITIELNQNYYSGKQFRIVTHNNSAQNTYIQKAELDGRDWDNAWFHHDQFADGGTLELWLGPEPNKRWGVDELPPSESESAGNDPVFATDIAITGPDRAVEPYGSVDYDAEVVPDDTTLKEVFWSVTEPDGSPTEKATIDQDGVLTINHRAGEVLVTATAADSGGVASSKTVTIAPDASLLRGNAACWPDVTATASSEFSDAYLVENVFDGCDGGTRDWASKAELDPWMQLEWSKPIQADKIVLRDRVGGDNVNGGVLTFSDGSSIPVSDIPTDTDPKTVTFDLKTFTWVRFQIEGGTGWNNGLLEFEVYAVPSAPEAAQEVTAEAGDGSATVSWRPPAFDGGAPITAYVITPYHNGTALDPIEVAGDARSVVVSDLTAGEPYTFTVTAKNMAGAGPESQPSLEVRPR
ncbi:glycoside hydrolase domain-containing protein [Actinopolymorpha sp. B17G11]|uniref:glycoside hydrolase domain-containing protein n=1 Tax=Actinopolymorpha sp. B17G11 TaxID=3160861 RepID=UPI0032E4D659